uniref:Ribosomal protein S4 X-linked n=1 Tax=Anser cygnoides TaxID=8845 RepID=A0A8B9D4F7_ANSCY
MLRGELPAWPRRACGASLSPLMHLYLWLPHGADPGWLELRLKEARKLWRRDTGLSWVWEKAASAVWPQASGRKEEKCLGVSFCKKMQAAFVGRLKAGVPHLSSAGFCLQYKLCKVRKIFVGTKGIPHLVTHDARTIRYPDPLIKVNDTIQIDLETGKITDFIKFDTGNLCMVTGGANLGRIGVITNRERHPGSFDVVHVKDANGNSFATRLSNIFVIGKGNKPWISLPRGKGIRLTIAEERDKRLAAKQSSG